MSRLAFQRSDQTIFLVMVIFALIVPESVPAQNAGNSTQKLDVRTIVSRMEQARLTNIAGCKAYSSIREYNLYGSTEADLKSQVVARVDFIPPKWKNYEIEKAEGNDRGEMIVRHMLQAESEGLQKTNPPGAVDSANYNFELLGQSTLEGHLVYVLRIIPRRHEVALIDGVAYVDQNAFLVRRIDGELSKNPSWWIKKVHTVVDFGDQEGVWLQKSLRSTADIRIIGPHIFTERTVSVSTEEQSAQNRTLAPTQVQPRIMPGSQQRHTAEPSVVLGTGVLGR